MKKLVHPEPTPRLLMSRGHSRILSAPRRAVFAAFGLDDYQDASVPRIYERSRIRREAVVDGDYPDNVVRFTTLSTPRRKA
jgi:hypothetical protein